MKKLYISFSVSHRHIYSHSVSINAYINKGMYLSTKILFDYEVFATFV